MPTRRSRRPTCSRRPSRCRAAPASRSRTDSIVRFSRRTGTRPIGPLPSRRSTSIYRVNANTYAALYNGILQRDWFYAQARGYKTMLDAALHGNNIPTAVVENLVVQTKAGVAPLQRYHALRRRVLGLEAYHTYDSAIPLVDLDEKFPYDDVLDWLPKSVEPLGSSYQEQMRGILASRCIDVYENAGKRSGAYSAPVYGVRRSCS
ncbi:MAG: M3 family metallopeptidase [Vicinamibacterales bacterium]